MDENIFKAEHFEFGLTVNGQKILLHGIGYTGVPSLCAELGGQAAICANARFREWVEGLPRRYCDAYGQALSQINPERRYVQRVEVVFIEEPEPASLIL